MEMALKLSMSCHCGSWLHLSFEHFDEGKNIFLRETNCVIHRIGIYSVHSGVIHPLISWGLGAR